MPADICVRARHTCARIGLAHVELLKRLCTCPSVRLRVRIFVRAFSLCASVCMPKRVRSGARTCASVRACACVRACASVCACDRRVIPSP
eukprot:2529146-Pleurochrysis_carterae.AAC.2